MLFHSKIRLRNLAASEKFDTRTYNFCVKNGLMDLDSIIQHYIYNGDFSNLKRANVASNQKLISVCKKYLTDQPQPIVKSTLKLNNDESSNEAKDFLEPDGTNSKSESESLVLTSDILIQPSSDEVILKEPKIEILITECMSWLKWKD